MILKLVFEDLSFVWVMSWVRAFLFSKDFSLAQKQKLISFYSYSMVILASLFSIRALVRYFMLDDIRVFFYHGENEDDYGLVPKLLNAIHVSVFVALALVLTLSQSDVLS